MVVMPGSHIVVPVQQLLKRVKNLLAPYQAIYSEIEARFEAILAKHRDAR